MNKFLVGASAAAIMLASVVPAFASSAFVTTNTYSSANTGLNSGSYAGVTNNRVGMAMGGASANGATTNVTGNAAAKSLGLTAVNTNVRVCPSCVGGSEAHDFAVVKGDTQAVANTGTNSGSGSEVKNTYVGMAMGGANANGATTNVTGNAKAKSLGITLVNTNVKVGTRGLN